MRFLFLVFFSLFVCQYSLQAQSMGELTDKEKYDQLKRNIELIQVDIDSVKYQLTLLKDSASLNTEYRSVLIKPIMAYESTLFDLKSEIGALQAKGAVFEHKFLLSQSNTLDSTVVDKNESLYILDAEFVKKNISAEDREILLSEIYLDSLYIESISKIDTIYRKIKAIDVELRMEGVEMKVADSMTLIVDSCMVEAENIEEEFLDKWNNIYETKLYIYSRIMQQLNTPGDVIAQLGSEGRDMKAKILVKNENIFADGLYSYYDEKRHSNQYEKIVAETIVAQAVVDSINSVIDKDREDFNRNITIDFPDFSYPTYEKVRVYKQIRYTGEGVDLPNLEVPTVGSIYSIRIITFSKPLLPKSNVRKLEPLFRFENVKKYTEYYAGVYKTKKEAQADLKRVSPLGFSPMISQFKDGGKVMPDGSIFPVDAYQNVYYLEFDTMNDELENKLKELAPTKQITLIGSDTYSLGVFEDYNELIILQEQLENKGAIVKVKL